MENNATIIEAYYDDSEIISVITEQTEIFEELNTNTIQLLEVTRAQYISNLFVIGSVSAIFVCLLLYKFLKSFF